MYKKPEFERVYHAAVTIPGPRLVAPWDEPRAVFDYIFETLDREETNVQNAHKEDLEERDAEIAELTKEVESLNEFLKTLGE